MKNPISHRYTLPLEAQPLEILQPLAPLGRMRINPPGLMRLVEAEVVAKLEGGRSGA